MTRDEHLALLAEKLTLREREWHVARRSAALVYVLPLIGSVPSSAQLVRDRAASKTSAVDRHARVSTLPAEQRWSYGGLPICSPARAVVDVARQEPFRNGLVLADGALRRGVTREEMLAVLRQMRRWPHVAQATAVVDFADGRAETPVESLARFACRVENLPIPEPQVEVYRRGEFVARLDLLIRGALLAIEPDGAIKFDDEGVLPALLHRHEVIKDCGIEVVRTNWNELFRDAKTFGWRVRDRMRDTSRRLAPGVELRSTVLQVQRPFLVADLLAA